MTPPPPALNLDHHLRPVVAARRAPIVYALVLIHPIPTFAFTLWAVNGLLHCDDEEVSCGLGFAVHLLLPAAVGVVVAAAAGVVGLVARPASRIRAWLLLVLPTALTWLTLWWALAVTKTT